MVDGVLCILLIAPIEILLIEHFSPELNIAEIDSIIPAIEIACKNAQDLLGILFDIEENKPNQNSTFV